MPARVIGAPNQVVRRQQGALGVSDVANAHLRAAAENVAHPVDTGQASKVATPAPVITTIQQTRPVDTGVEGATPDDTRSQDRGGGDGGNRSHAGGRPI